MIAKNSFILGTGFKILGIIQNNPCVNQSKLSFLSGHNMSHILGVISQLEDRELISRKRHDNRSYELTITKKGEEIITLFRKLEALL
jgi:predicted transcriptional regulator